MLQKHESLPLSMQKADFRSCLTEDMRQHLKCAIEIDANDDEVSVNAILDEIQKHLRQKRNIAIDRVAFENRKQEEGESFDQYYVALKKLATESSLCEQCVDSRLVTKIMAGISNHK